MISLVRKRNPLEGLGTLPPVVLFTGARWSGRMTLALESIRQELCTQSKEPNCTCLSCISLANLSSPDLLILGNRDFMAYIRGVGEAALKECTPERFTLLIRSVRMLLSRWQPFLYDSGEGKYKKPLKLALQLEEYIFQQESLGGGVFTIPKGKKAETFIRGLIKQSEQLCKEMKQRNLTIGMVRNMEEWLRRPPEGSQKSIIIEGADTLSPAVANGLLKILEEPPQYLRFILIGQNRSRVLATILSRSRHISVPPYREDEVAQIVQKVFAKDLSDVQTLQDLSLIFGGVDLMGLRGLAEVYVETLTSSRIWGEEETVSLVEHLSSEEAFYAFLSILRGDILQLMANYQSRGDLSPQRGQEWYEAIRKAEHRYSSLKLSIPLIIQSLSQEMKEASL